MGLSEIAYPMGLASALTFSWGVLLIFADRKPLERKWILIPTLLVIVLLTLVRILFSLNGTVAFSSVFIIIGFILVVFMAYSYYYATSFNANN